jgi:flagellar basal body-associated protein FliL
MVQTVFVMMLIVVLVVVMMMLMLVFMHMLVMMAIICGALKGRHDYKTLQQPTKPKFLFVRTEIA